MDNPVERDGKFHCPNCGTTLVKEESGGRGGYSEKIKGHIFDSLYDIIALKRGPRYICPKCKKNKVSQYKFKKNILGNIRDNWWFDDALRKSRKK